MNDPSESYDYVQLEHVQQRDTVPPPKKIEEKNLEVKDILPEEFEQGIRHDYFRGMYQKYRLSEDPEAPQKLKEAMLSDVNAWSLICALILTISLGALVAISEGDFHVDDAVGEIPNKVFKYLYISSLLISTSCNIIAIRICVLTYVTLSGIPIKLIGCYFLSKFGSYTGWLSFDHYSTWVDLGLLSLLIGFTSGIFLLYGWTAIIPAILITAVTVWFYMKTAEAVGHIMSSMLSLEDAKIKWNVK